MKKTVRLLSIMAVIVAGCTTACGQNAIKNTADDSGKVKVMTSFYTMYDFAQKIGGEKVEITNMVPSGTEPHDWEPSAIDIRNMEDDRNDRAGQRCLCRCAGGAAEAARYSAAGAQKDRSPHRYGKDGPRRRGQKASGISRQRHGGDRAFRGGYGICQGL